MMQMAKSSWRAGCILCLFLMPCSQRNHNLIDNLTHEDPFYWLLFERGGIYFIYFVIIYAGGWLEFHFMVHALHAGLVDLIDELDFISLI